MPLFYSALLIAPILLVVGQAAYNLFFHPLREYPGPLHTRASKWPWFYQRVRGTQVPWITDLHRRYGDVVRVAPNHLSYINGEAWKDIYGHRTSAGRGNLAKDKEFYPGAPVGKTSIIIADDVDHARVRRSVAHAFSEKALLEQEPLIRHYTGLLVDKLREAASGDGGALDMVAMYNYTTFDIMADLAFGKSLGMIESASYVPWVESIIGVVKFAGIFGPINNAFPLLMPLIQRTFLRKMREKRAAHGAFAVEHVDARLARETTRPDIWTFVLRNTAKNAAKGGLDREEMHSLGFTLMGAGTETTSTLLSGLTWWLCKTPDKLARLEEEVRQAFHSEEDITMQALARLPYLTACIQEGLRLYPPAALGLPRIAPPGGAVICGKPVAAKTIVYVSHYAAYHNESNFHDPDNFHPERWLPDADLRFANDKHNVFEPFSFGPRNCVGKNLAWHEMRTILANIILNFDMQLSDRNDENWIDQTAWLVWNKKPLFVDMKPKAQEVKA